MSTADEKVQIAAQADTRVAHDRWLSLGAVAVLMALVVRNAWIAEDAYLTLRTIDNWVAGYGLRWNVAERVQAYTHPLWMLLITLPYLLLRDPYAAAMITSLLVTLAAVLALVFTARSGYHALAAVSLLLLSRAFVDFSTSGLENPLSHLLLACLVWLYAVRRASTFSIALSAALLALNRTDTLLVALPPLFHTAYLSLRARGLKPTARSLALGLSPWLAWELFSLFYYGFLVPNTAFAKLNTGVSRGDLTRQGLSYLLNAVAWDPALLFVVTLGLGVALLRRQPRASLLGLSALLYVVYVVSIGGDFMQGRFLTVPVFLAACLVAITPLAVQDFGKVAALLLPAVALFTLPSATDLAHGDADVADERSIFESSLGLLAYTRTQSFPTHIFRDDGEALASHAQAEPVVPGYNVGLTGFYAGPEVHIVDSNALSEPLLARLPMRHDPHWRIGHFTRHIPAGYLETLRTGRCQMDDADLCAYHDKLREIVAGDLWSWSRLESIAAMNVGAYQHLIDRDRYRFPKRKRELLTNLSAVIPEDASWMDPRARVIPDDGIEIELGTLSHARQVVISFDGNDKYQVAFKHGRESYTVVSPAKAAAGMHTRTLETPGEAVLSGFDRLAVRPLRGDGMYSLGYVRLQP